MACDITFTKRGSTLRFFGPLIIKDIHDANAKLYGSAEFDTHTYTLWDLLDADLSRVTEQEADQAAATDKAAALSVPSMRVALVAHDNHAIKICERYRNSLIEMGCSWKCRLFDSIDAAQEWVDY